MSDADMVAMNFENFLGSDAVDFDTSSLWTILPDATHCTMGWETTVPTAYVNVVTAVEQVVTFGNSIKTDLADDFEITLYVVTPGGNKQTGTLAIKAPAKYKNPCEPPYQIFTATAVATWSYTLGDELEASLIHTASWDQTYPTNHNMVCSWSFRASSPTADLADYIRADGAGQPGLNAMPFLSSSLAGEHTLTIIPVSAAGVDMTV
jgi:hypothetical protein